MRLIRLAFHFFRIGALNELQYRVNFFVQLLQSAVALAVGLIGLELVFSHTQALAGWSQPELLAVMGVHILMGGIIQAFIQPNMLRLMEDIQQGTLDFALTKPEDAQVLISVREIRIWQLVNVLIGVLVLISALIQIGGQIDLFAALAFALALGLGGIMLYSFWLILTSISFWVVRMDEMVNLFEGIYAAGRWPVGIYPGWLRGILTFIVPVAFAVTIPAEALTSRLNPMSLGLAGGVAVAMLLVARLVWQRGLRQYGGASA
ncbi:ABC transporter permease [Candidatus Oscillochloris fontis]|uniref:ABC transporter permease n=1 Tax=Candidatus Oscillochloris fontis TaxID=2496868 RepID=UPI00101C567A|nr:ABC-2 family transporter protein [Candidatus Oscillochloris fontis]